MLHPLRIFSLAAIAYGLLITTFFARAKTAATVGSILFYTTSFLGRKRVIFSFPVCVFFSSNPGFSDRLTIPIFQSKVNRMFSDLKPIKEMNSDAAFRSDTSESASQGDMIDL